MRPCVSPAVFAVILAAGACAKPPAGMAPEPEVRYDTVYVDRTVTRVDTVADPDTRQRLSQVEADVLEREARIQVLEDQLEEAQREVVRIMARSQTVASQAEAASGMAEAELAIRTLRTAAGGRSTPELAQAGRLLDRSSNEFKRGNFGGALYLASRARAVAGQGTDRFSRAEGDDLLPGETRFPAPLRMRSTTRSNVREGPGTNFRVLFTIDGDHPLTASSQVEGWVRVTDDQGRSGWISRSLVESRN